MAELIDVPPGLAGVAVAETEIGDVLGDRGYYHYRGRNAAELARSSTFERVAALVLDGTDDEPLDADRSLPEAVVALVPHLGLRSLLSATGEALGLRPLTVTPPDEQRRAARRLVALMPTLVASAVHRRAVAPDPSLGHAADFARMLTGAPPTPEVAAALEAYLILTIDHGFNTGTFAARVVASTGTDLAACVVAGFGALSGPRHGADTERVLAMFEAIGEPDRAEAWLRDEMANRRRLQGFGHAVYRATDPRLALLKEHGAVVAPDLHRIAVAVEEAGTRLLAGRRLVPNIDLHAAVVLEGCGVPRGSFTAAFATARIVAWCAHAIEQARDDKVLRPAARYVGPPPDDDVY